jgi:hypothetical protein
VLGWGGPGAAPPPPKLPPAPRFGTFVIHLD